MNDTVDIDAFLNLNDYDDGTFASPNLSPASSKAPTFLKHEQVSTPATISPSQPLCGPSHDYGLYKQQTPFAPGALQMTYMSGPVGGYNSGIDLFATSPGADFDFNAPLSQNSSSVMDLDFGSPTLDNSPSFEPSLNSAVSDSSPIVASSSSTTTTTTSNVGRMWPGMHQQAALAKAQAQERQQQIIAQQRRLQAKQPVVQQPQPQPQQQQRTKAGPPTDPIVEQKITQLLNSMRAKPASPEDSQSQTVSPLTRIRKDEEDMDEDERLLASEEGKKLTSKERRQLRNKVSARAFRSRRKEYITQLETEITNRVTENGELRSQNRALLEENRRLTDLTKMLLSSASFSTFLDQLSTNPALLPAAPQPEPQPQQPEQAPAPRQMPKDVNPNSYRAGNSSQQQQQQIGLTLIPEQSLDIDTLGLGTDSLIPGGFAFAPQVFTAVIETPDLPEVLGGKVSSHFDDEDSDDLYSEDDGKVGFTVPAVEDDEKAVEIPAPVVAPTEQVDDGSDLFDDVDEDEAAIASALSVPQPAQFQGVSSEKPSAERIEIKVTKAEPVENEEESPEIVADKAMRRVERISKRIEGLTRRFEDLAGL